MPSRLPQTLRYAVLFCACGSALADYAGASAPARLAVVREASAENRLSNKAFVSQERSLRLLPSGALNRQFALADVLAAKLTVIKGRASSFEQEIDEWVIWRNPAGVFATRQGLVPVGLMEGLIAAVPSARPALGLHSCSGEGEPSGPPAEDSVEISLLIKQRRPLRLFSSSSCVHRLPWNVTDGEHWAVVDQKTAGRRMAALVQALCQDCQVFSSPLPLPGIAVGGQTGFGQHYAALLSEWQRLGKGHSLAWMALQTQPLLAALKQMDRPRLEAMLKQSAKTETGTAGPWARTTLRLLREQRWGYIDKTGHWALPRRFDLAGTFGGDSALVRLDGEWLLIDKLGQPVEHAHTGEPVYLPIRLKPTEKAGQWGFVDAKGEWVIPAQFEAARDFSEGLAAVQQGGLWGYIDEGGRVVITPQFSEAGEFGQDLAPVR